MSGISGPVRCMRCRTDSGTPAKDSPSHRRPRPSGGRRSRLATLALSSPSHPALTTPRPPLPYLLACEAWSPPRPALQIPASTPSALSSPSPHSSRSFPPLVLLPPFARANEPRPSLIPPTVLVLLISLLILAVWGTVIPAVTRFSALFPRYLPPSSSSSCPLSAAPSLPWLASPRPASRLPTLPYPCLHNRSPLALAPRHLPSRPAVSITLSPSPYPHTFAFSFLPSRTTLGVLLPPLHHPRLLPLPLHLAFSALFPLPPCRRIEGQLSPPSSPCRSLLTLPAFCQILPVLCLISGCSAHRLLTHAAVSSPCSPSTHSSALIPPCTSLVTITPALVPSPRMPGTRATPHPLAVAVIAIATLPSSPALSACVWKVPRERGL